MLCALTGTTVPLDGSWVLLASIANLWLPPGWSLEYDGPAVRAVTNGLVD